LVENRQFEPTPPLFRWNFAKIFGVRTLESLGYRVAVFAWSYV